ncbi:hypothetical protein C7447_102242 [Tenacibaculum adriaticum]|uniref:Sugar transporter n=1 Tax=Tenacibaculum adriaticum TaxID=413713 RepID=A0A5S5DTB6_9FLAO|nr:hypothetical protein [Tenacibaculum adriaticum]TYP98924.1 hypothetical protein C7447_102242 [Tenacibaculum adriaticum]
MSNTNKPTAVFWIIAVVALLWNASGVNMYLQQAYGTDSFKAMYTDEKVLEMVLNTPSWVMAAFAIAVFAGLFGSILLLLRKKLAKPVFIVSIVGIVVQVFYNVFISNSIEIVGTSAVVMPIVVLLFGVFLIWYTQKADAKGWLS